MTCIRPELIQKYIDNEASINEKDFVEEHLKHCGICHKKVESRKQFAQLVVKSINNMAKEYEYIPAFVPERNVSRIHLKRKFIYGLSAAVVFLLIMLTILKNPAQKPMHVNIVNAIGPEVDANKPVTQQDMVIKVIDQDGNVTELGLE